MLGQGDERDRSAEVDEGVPKDNGGYSRNGTCRDYLIGRVQDIQCIPSRLLNNSDTLQFSKS